MTAVTRSRAGRAITASLKTTTTKKKVATATQKRKRPAASASEGAQIPKAGRKTLAEASFILKLKEEAFDLWKQRHVPGALERWVKAKAEEKRPKKTKMVIKTVLSREFVDLIRMQQPGLIKGFPAEEIARQSEACRRLHAMHRYINRKMYDYQQALIDQYMSQGYAEDEDEVTTDGEQD